MNQFKNLLYFFIIIVFIKLIFFYYIIVGSNINETFNNCPDNVFCSYNLNENKCKCVLQKDDVRTNFPLDRKCCNEKCTEKDINNCNQNSDNQTSYFCPIAGKCQEYKANINSDQISSNNCGYDILNNQLILPFSTLDECVKQLDPCEKYNDQQYTRSERINNCLSDINCGTCSNSDGDIKCISGTAKGPSDLAKYYYCDPTNKESKNKYVYGNNAQFILQK